MGVPSRDGQPALAAIAETAARLSHATEALIYRKDRDQLRLVARHGSRRTPSAFREVRPINRATTHGRAILDRGTIRAGAVVATPMLRGGAPVGVIVVRRVRARPFSNGQVSLLEAFAAQAAVVIQELDVRDRELAESLEQQTATAAILRAISSSTTDMQLVFDLIAENAVRLCHGHFGGVFQFDGELVHLLAQHGLSPEGAEVYSRLFPRPAGRDTAIGRALLDRAIVHIPDVQGDPEYGLTALALVGTMTCIVAVPVLREGTPIGGIVAWQSKPEPFPDKQIELLKTFADQALIAIENVRLFTEVQARNRELTETLEQQTATAEILRAISGSPTDLQPVLDTVVRAAARFCGATDVAILRLDGQTLRGAAGVGPFPDVIARQVGSLAALEIPVTRGSVTGRAVVERRTVHVHDLAAAPPDEFPEGRELQRRLGHRTMVATPLLREGTPLGVIALFRMVVDPFSDKQLELLRVFADQAVIAIENVRLFRELETRNRDLTETLEQQTATSEILRAISSSPTDVQPVFDAIVGSATRLCEAHFSSVARFDGGLLHLVALNNMSPEETAAYHSLFPRPVGRHFIMGRAFIDGRPVHVEDVLADPDYDPRTLDVLQRASRYRTFLGVPIVRNGVAIGAIGCGRREVEPFTPSQIELVKTFADQAVIAIENVRLFQELEARNRDLTETLEQQTATGEILRVISGSPTDVQPVFHAIAEAALRLCGAASSIVTTFDGDLIHLSARAHIEPEGTDALRRVYPRRPGRGIAAGRAILTRAIVRIADVRADAEYEHHHLAQVAEFRSILAVPMLRDGLPIGTINVHKAEPAPFTDNQVELLKTFADQAVIAIENVRLFKELEARNRDLTETLEQQTATGEILRVISSSPTDVQPVFDTIAQSAKRLCEAHFCQLYRFDGTLLHLVAHHGLAPEGVDTVRRAYPMAPGRGSAAARAVVSGAVEHIPDVHADPEYGHGTVARAANFRSIVAVPMVRDGVPIGAIAVARVETGPFPDRQIDLLKTFADQAVIAIENVRLFKELEARNRDLTETLEQQTATSEILRVISSSPTDVQPVLEAVVESAARLCHVPNAAIFRVDGDLLRLAATCGYAGRLRSIGEGRPISRNWVTGRAVVDRSAVHVHDLSTSEAEFPEGAADAKQYGHRTTLATPLLREGVPVGAILIRGMEVRPFTDKEIDLLKTFADQAVIAIDNVRLFKELEARTTQLTRSVGELRALGEVSQAVSSTLDLETVLETIVSHAVELSSSYSGIIYEFDEATQTFHARATHRITPDYLEALRAAPIHLGEGAIGRAGVIREPVEVANIEDEGQLVAPQVRGLLAREGVRSFLAVPLIREQRLLGGLVILRQERGAFSPEVVATLQTFAAQSVLAIHNAGLFREIQRQKQYADALVETSPVAIATMDLRGTVVGWNPGAERLFGYSPAEALGRQVDDLVATPEIREEVRANLREALRGERIRAITRRARKDGTLVDVEVSSVPVVVDGAEVGFIAIYHDITELLRARREAEAATEAKSAFLATMSHEIRTPMNAVIGMSGLLLNTPLTDEQREYAEVVRQSGDALLTVINDILDFSKIEAGKLELESQPFDVMECIEGALDLIATRAAEKGLDLAYLIGDGTPTAIVGDVTRLRQILLNLLSNAVKFTERGEVVLSVNARRLDGAAPLHELTFSVRDTGIGIPADRLGRLFESFSQVDASTTRRYGGTGLGLAISRRLTELMGGRISVTSEVGAGTEFRFTIRAVAAETPLPARRDLSGVQPSLRDKRVLVVDDNATNRRILTAHLDAWGMRPRATESPGEALGWIGADERFDVGILDMHMPEMDGVALARAIREHPAGTALPLVLFTSLGRREARAESEGFAAHLHKPIKPSQLFDALVSVLAEQPVHVPERGVARSEFAPDMARRHPLRILLAEDNVVNQKVALRLLGQMGYRADVAANGLEAIDAVERQTYDVVLMDVQMPELDGFEASREINRRWPGKRRPRIVAMTANAMQGDRELCAAAGMDDYVAKPIRVEELVAAIERCRRRPDAAARGAAAAGVPSVRGPGAPVSEGAPEAAVIDRTAVDRLTATMGGAFVVELIDTFTEDARGLVAGLRQALAETDVDAFRRAAHSLKSTSETLGAMGLAGLARELEAQARAGSLDGTGARLEQLAGTCEIVTRTLGELRRDLPA